MIRVLPSFRFPAWVSWSLPWLPWRSVPGICPNCSVAGRRRIPACCLWLQLLRECPSCWRGVSGGTLPCSAGPVCSGLVLSLPSTGCGDALGNIGAHSWGGTRSERRLLRWFEQCPVEDEVWWNLINTNTVYIKNYRIDLNI